MVNNELSWGDWSGGSRAFWEWSICSWIQTLIGCYCDWQSPFYRGGAAAALSSAGWYEADSQSRQNQPHMTEDGFGPYITYKSISVRGSLPGLQIFWILHVQCISFYLVSSSCLYLESKRVILLSVVILKHLLWFHCLGHPALPYRSPDKPRLETTVTCSSPEAVPTQHESASTHCWTIMHWLTSL